MEKANALKVGLAFVGVTVNTETADLIISMTEEINLLGNSFSIKDASRIESAIKIKYMQMQQEMQKQQMQQMPRGMRGAMMDAQGQMMPMPEEMKDKD